MQRNCPKSAPYCELFQVYKTPCSMLQGIFRLIKLNWHYDIYRETLEVLSLTRVESSMFSSATTVLVMSALWAGNTEFTAGSPSSESGLKKSWVPLNTAPLDLMPTLRKENIRNVVITLIVFDNKIYNFITFKAYGGLSTDLTRCIVKWWLTEQLYYPNIKLRNNCADPSSPTTLWGWH